MAEETEKNMDEIRGQRELAKQQSWLSEHREYCRGKGEVTRVSDSMAALEAAYYE